MMITAEKAIQNAITAARRSVHQTSFLCALVHAVVRSTTQRAPAVIGAVIILMVGKEAVIGDARWGNLVMAGLLIVVLVFYLISEHQHRG